MRRPPSSSRSRARIVAFGGAALVGLPPTAQAHLVQTGFGAFYDGVVHLVLTPGDLLVVIGLGLLAGSRGAAAARSMVLALPAALAVGSLAGSLARGGSVSFAWATSVTCGVAGALVAADLKTPRPVVLALGVVFGLMHGAIEGATAGGGRISGLAIAGTAAACFAVVTLTSSLVVGMRASWTRVAVRVAGSWLAAIAMLMGGWIARGR